jgi:hypothetical protein
MQISCKRPAKTNVPQRATGAPLPKELYGFALVGCISGLGGSPAWHPPFEGPLEVQARLFPRPPEAAEQSTDAATTPHVRFQGWTPHF